jgi:hypothetical protein
MARLRMIRAIVLGATLALLNPLPLAGAVKAPASSSQGVLARAIRLAEPLARPKIAARGNVVLLKGVATWYDATRGGGSSWYTRQGILFYGAAGPALREIVPSKYKGRYQILVTSTLTKRSIYVDVVDWCGCTAGTSDPSDDRIIDLSPNVWRALGVPLGRGIMPITIEVVRP